MTYHHRGLLHDISGLKAEAPRSQTLVVLGNGPSLKGFGTSIGCAHTMRSG